jgi:hypothetical protein
MNADPKCQKRHVVLTLALSAAALAAVPYTVSATDTQKKLTTTPAVQLPAKAQNAPAIGTLPATKGAPSMTTPAGVAPDAGMNGVDRARQANQARGAQQMRQMNDMRQGMQGAAAMPNGGQHRSGTGVPGAGRPDTGRVPGVSASGQDGGAHTGGGSRSGGAHTGGAMPYLPGFEPRGAHTGGDANSAGGGAHTGGSARDPFVRDVSGNPVSQPATRSMGSEDDKKNSNAGQPVNNTNAGSNTNAGADKPKEVKPKEDKPSYEKQDQPVKEKETAGKEPKEKTDKNTVMPREDSAGSATPRMTSNQQGSGPGARRGGDSGVAQGPRVRATGTDVNPQVDAPRGGFAPRSRDQMGGAGPGTRPGEGVYGRDD